MKLDTYRVLNKHLTLLSSSLAAEKYHVRCLLLKCTILKGKTLLDVVSSVALMTLLTKQKLCEKYLAKILSHPFYTKGKDSKNQKITHEVQFYFYFINGRFNNSSTQKPGCRFIFRFLMNQL